MQEKIEEIKHIQYSLWGMYKDFLKNKDYGRYIEKSNSFLNDCKEPLKHFCRNLVITWTAVVDGILEDFMNRRDVREKTDCIKHIQNTVWGMYKAFLSDHDMKAYSRKAGELTGEYAEKGDQQLLTFCQHLLITWCPVINTFAEEFRHETEEEAVQDGKNNERV